MIHSVKIQNYLGEELVMELERPEKSGFLVLNMTGLGPERADIRMTEIVTNDGSIYNSARLPPRNIVLSLLFYPKDNETVEEMRHRSYKFFPIKKPVTLTITTDDRVCEITGNVESNEPVIFAKQCYTQLSIICPYPYFYAGGDKANNVTVFYGTDPMFEFPFSNESLTEPLLKFAEILNDSERLVEYDGDAEIGVTIIMDAIGPISNITIHNVGTRQSLFINTNRLAEITGKGFGAGDRITISSVAGIKSITLLRNGVETNILNVLDKGSVWFSLTKGDNIFAFVAASGTEFLMFRVENRILYEGV